MREDMAGRKPNFEKRHYEFLANLFNYELEVRSDETEKNVIKGMARLLASRLSADNPKFDRTRFLKACGIVEVIYPIRGRMESE
jgi:hypothetical protein